MFSKQRKSDNLGNKFNPDHPFFNSFHVVSTSIIYIIIIYNFIRSLFFIQKNKKHNKTFQLITEYTVLLCLLYNLIFMLYLTFWGDHNLFHWIGFFIFVAFQIIIIFYINKSQFTYSSYLQLCRFSYLLCWRILFQLKPPTYKTQLKNQYTHGKGYVGLSTNSPWNKSLTGSSKHYGKLNKKNVVYSDTPESYVSDVSDDLNASTTPNTYRYHIKPNNTYRYAKQSFS